MGPWTKGKLHSAYEADASVPALPICVEHRAGYPVSLLLLQSPTHAFGKASILKKAKYDCMLNKTLSSVIATQVNASMSSSAPAINILKNANLIRMQPP